MIYKKTCYLFFLFYFNCHCTMAEDLERILKDIRTRANVVEENLNLIVKKSSENIENQTNPLNIHRLKQLFAQNKHRAVLYMYASSQKHALNMFQQSEAKYIYIMSLWALEYDAYAERESMSYLSSIQHNNKHADDAIYNIIKKILKNSQKKDKIKFLTFLSHLNQEFEPYVSIDEVTYGLNIFKDTTLSNLDHLIREPSHLNIRSAAFFLRAHQYIQKKYWNEATSDLLKILQSSLTPLKTESEYLLGVIYLYQKDFKQSESYLMQSSHDVKLYELSLQGLIILYIQSKNMHLLVKTCKAYMERFPQSQATPQVRDILLYYAIQGDFKDEYESISKHVNPFILRVQKEIHSLKSYDLHVVDLKNLDRLSRGYFETPQDIKYIIYMHSKIEIIEQILTDRIEKAENALSLFVYSKLRYADPEYHHHSIKKSEFIKNILKTQNIFDSIWSQKNLFSDEHTSSFFEYYRLKIKDMQSPVNFLEKQTMALELSTFWDIRSQYQHTSFLMAKIKHIPQPSHEQKEHILSLLNDITNFNSKMSRYFLEHKYKWRPDAFNESLILAILDVHHYQTSIFNKATFQANTFYNHRTLEALLDIHQRWGHLLDKSLSYLNNIDLGYKNKALLYCDNLIQIIKNTTQEKHHLNALKEKFRRLVLFHGESLLRNYELSFKLYKEKFHLHQSELSWQDFNRRKKKWEQKKMDMQ